VVSDSNQEDLKPLHMLQEVGLRGFDTLIMDNSSEERSIIEAAVKEENDRLHEKLHHRVFFQNTPLESLANTQSVTLANHLQMLLAVLNYSTGGCLEEDNERGLAVVSREDNGNNNSSESSSNLSVGSSKTGESDGDSGHDAIRLRYVGERSERDPSNTRRGTHCDMQLSRRVAVALRPICVEAQRAVIVF